MSPNRASSRWPDSGGRGADARARGSRAYRQRSAVPPRVAARQASTQYHRRKRGLNENHRVRRHHDQNCDDCGGNRRRLSILCAGALAVFLQTTGIDTRSMFTACSCFGRRSTRRSLLKGRILYGRLAHTRRPERLEPLSVARPFPFTAVNLRLFHLPVADDPRRRIQTAAPRRVRARPPTVSEVGADHAHLPAHRVPQLRQPAEAEAPSRMNRGSHTSSDRETVDKLPSLRVSSPVSHQNDYVS